MTNTFFQGGEQICRGIWTPLHPLVTDCMCASYIVIRLIGVSLSFVQIELCGHRMGTL